MYQLNKTSVINKAVQVGKSTLVSRIFGLARELLMARYLGSGHFADAFVTAYRIPNALRKIFAEGAASAALIPSFVKALRERGIEEASSLMTLCFIIFEGIVLLLCLGMMWYAPQIIHFFAPGFSDQQIQLTTSLFIILIPFILFLSCSALFAGALQAAGHFFVPAFAPIMLNVVIVIGILFCWAYHLPLSSFCFFILLGGFLQLCIHIFTYLKLDFVFGTITHRSFVLFQEIMSTFLPYALSMSVMEVSLIIDGRFASYLPEGSIALLYYANRFVMIPLGIFATSFSTILLPYFSQISMYAPKRLSFYLLESAKLVFWITIPTMLLMIFFAEKIFSTLLLSERFSYQHVLQGRLILIASVLGLFFFSLNKIVLNIYYALHQRAYTLFIALVALTVNVIMDIWLISSLQATGLALATTISAFAQTVVAYGILRYCFNFKLYPMVFIRFVYACIVQYMFVGGLFMIAYSCGEYMWTFFPFWVKIFFIHPFCYWLWAGPLSLATLTLLYYSRKYFTVNLYFLD